MSALRHVVLLGGLTLAGCASSPGIPDTNYYRLPPRQPIAVAATPVLSTPIEVDTFLADGVHSDQALLYSTDPDAELLRTYHYQLWVDPPTRMLQRRLLRTLAEANLAPLVSERLPAAPDSLRIQGRIEAFERVQRADGWHVLVALQFRVDRGAAELPLLMKDYRQERLTVSASVRDSVRALGACIDSAFAEFSRDLARLAAAP